MRRCVALVSLLALAAPALTPRPASAGRTPLDSRQTELIQKIAVADEQVTWLTGQLGAINSRRAELEQRIGVLGAELADAEGRLAVTDDELTGAERGLSVVEERQATAVSRLRELRGALDTRAAMLYKTGGGAYLEMLLGASSFRDLTNRASFLKKVFTEDRARLDAVARQSRELVQTRAQAEQTTADIARRRAAIRAERDEVAGLENQLSGARAQLLNEMASSERLLAQVRAQKAEYLRQLAVLQSESERIAALLRSRPGRRLVRPPSGLELAWPTAGSVTSPFGWRIHPIFRTRSFHAGIDIGAPYRQEVIAAAPGQVVFAAAHRGYGNLVVIDSGNGLATVYAHLSAFRVSVGQQVGPGRTIGRVGCTGYCTGPHLHFEVRLNGRPVNPMGFQG